MVREDILGGLRTALARGQSLRQAMMSFYNAGYIKQEIEEAARAVQAEISNPTQQQFIPGPTAPIFQRTNIMELDPNEKPKEVFSQTATFVQQPVQPQTIQKVSAYGPPVQPQAIVQQQVQPIAQPQVIVQPQTIQKVSAYGPPVQPQAIVQQQVQPIAQPQAIVQQPSIVAKPRGKAIIFILLALLLILIGGLIAVFFFKGEILSFFESV